MVFPFLMAMIKCTLQYVYNMLHYEISSSLSSNETAQANSQHCTKLHNEVHNLFYNKFYWKVDFLIVLILLNSRKIKFASSIEYSSY